MTDEEPLLKVRELTKHFGSARATAFALRRATPLRAVDGVSFDLRSGETLGLVGESGCGKSTVVNTLLRLDAPTTGTAFYRGEDIFAMSAARLRKLRRQIQVVLQDPYASLNPALTVERVVTEGLVAHKLVGNRSERRRRAGELLERVGLAAKDIDKFPHEFSGGQRQRIGIARALSLDPEIVICDEPVSALDVSIQAQILNLLVDLQKDLGLSYLFISHDLGVVRHIGDQVAVMYLGKIVEIGPRAQMYDSPRHPYTRALLASSPDLGLSQGHWEAPELRGELPDPSDPPSGCAFRTRCWKAAPRCSEEAPRFSVEGMGAGDARSRHEYRCHFPEGR